MSLTRRAFLQSTAVAPLAVYAPPVSASDPATILAAIGIFQKLLQYQSDRGDGASALLNAINNKVGVIISQLATIEASLAQITTQIAQLREDVLDAIGQQHARELFNAANAALVAITDIQREARIKLVSLDVRNPDRLGLDTRLEDAWKEFDQARRRLREYPQGRGIAPSVLLDAFVLADQSAFAAGFIDETAFAIIMERHLIWLAQMANPYLEFSVSAYARQAIAAEAEERSAIGKLAKSDPASAVAFGLLTQPTTHICTISYMEVRYFSTVPFSDWYRLRDNRYIIVPIYSVGTVNEKGALLFKGTTYQNYKTAQVMLGDGFSVWSTGDISGLDQKQCLKFTNPDHEIKSDAMVRNNLDREPHETTTFKKGIGGHVSDGFISKRGFVRTITTDGLATASEAQKLLDKVNHHILKRRLAEVAAETIAGNRAFATSLAAALPTVPR
jgi:hypothetical protein